MAPAVALALAAALAAGSSSTSSSSSNGDGTSEPLSHPYNVYWPERAPTGIVVFLHGVSLDPLEEEGDGIEEVAARAIQRGLIAVFPLGDRLCDRTPGQFERCWNLDAIDDEVDAIRRILIDVQQRAGVCLAERQIVGFSNGAFLVAGALQRGLLEGFTKVGIVAGGPVGDARPPPTDKPPRVYVEVGEDDRWQKSSTRELFDMLLNETYLVSYREAPGISHVWDATHAAEFFAWFWDEG